MKLLFILFAISPIVAVSQKIKVNEFDKFSKLRRVEAEPLPLLSSEKWRVTMNYSAEGPSLLLTLNGYGWGSNTIDGSNNLIFLFSNDNTISLKSIGLQSYEMGAMHSTYKHQYFMTVQDLNALSQFDLVGIRKYGFKDYSDLNVSKDLASKIKKLSVLFVEELKKARIIQTLVNIDLKDISKHIDDSVMFCSKVYSSRYYQSSDNKPTILDVNNDFSNPLRIVIWEDNRKLFNNSPEALYINRDVCIKGVVTLTNNVPQIAIRNRNQIVVTSPITLDEIPQFIGDSITVKGKIAGAKYFSNTLNTPTLLNMGADYPNQAVTVLIEKKERALFEGMPEETYLNKDIEVTGKIILYKEKPQIKIYSKSQIKIIGEETLTMAKPAVNTSMVSNLQTQQPSTTSASFEDASTNSNTMAQFPGGSDAAMNFIKANLIMPAKVATGQKIIVFVRFSVSEKGEIDNISVVKSAGPVIDKEAVNVIKKMPNWIPSTKEGKPVSTMITQQVIFTGGENYANQQ